MVRPHPHAAHPVRERERWALAAVFCCGSLACRYRSLSCWRFSGTSAARCRQLGSGMPVRRGAATRRRTTEATKKQHQPRGTNFVKNEMQGGRRSTRRTKRLRGRLYFQVANRRSSLPCLVRDISYEGARIVVAGRSKIPDELDLYIPERKRIAHASVRWRHGARVGLVLTNVAPARR